jgi:biopolymer transport protein ExbB
MKKLLAFISLAGILAFNLPSMLNAQDTAVAEADTATLVSDSTQEVASIVDVAEVAAPVETSLHKVIKQKFIEGGVNWMTPILIMLIIGLALVIERIIYLSLSTTNTEKLLKDIEVALQNGGVDAAKEVCRNTRGPVASIFYQGLDRANEGIEIVEKSVVAYGGVQMGQLEKGLTWISLFIAIAPMMGFLGTVVGMVQAFDAIEIQGDISPTIVAGGIKVALLTTIFGLIVAMIMQVFYNYLVSKIDNIVNSMEDSSITLIDMLVKYNKK